MTAPGGAVGIVLAAGASRRAGSIKALAEIDGRALVHIISDTLVAGGCERVVVVVGPPHQAAIESALGGRYTVVENPEPGLGMLHSLQLALGATRDADSWVVALVDHPSVRPETVSALLAAHAQGRGVVLQPGYGGRRGHPFVVDHAAFDTILDADPTAVTRDVLQTAGDRVTVTVDDPGVVEDLDTRTELEKIGASVTR